MLGLSLGDKLPETLDDIAGAQSLDRAAVQRLANTLLVDLIRLQQSCRTAEIARDRRQRLIELVRQRGRHFAHCGQTGNMDQF